MFAYLTLTLKKSSFVSVALKLLQPKEDFVLEFDSQSAFLVFCFSFLSTSGEDLPSLSIMCFVMSFIYLCICVNMVFICRQ